MPEVEPASRAAAPAHGLRALPEAGPAEAAQWSPAAAKPEREAAAAAAIPPERAAAIREVATASAVADTPGPVVLPRLTPSRARRNRDILSSKAEHLSRTAGKPN
jgi:hypothetical protein